eukprot:2698483-Amphidinium_carterae.2
MEEDEREFRSQARSDSEPDVELAPAPGLRLEPAPSPGLRLELAPGVRLEPGPGGCADSEKRVLGQHEHVRHWESRCNSTGLICGWDPDPLPPPRCGHLHDVVVAPTPHNVMLLQSLMLRVSLDILPPHAQYAMPAGVGAAKRGATKCTGV